MTVSDEEEKQEIELDSITVDDLADIATNEGLEAPHDSDPEVTPSKPDDATGTVADQESEEEPPSKKHSWSRFTLALVFAVVALTAALVITIPVLLTRDNNGSSGSTNALTTDKQFSGTDGADGTVIGDRQGTPPPVSTLPPVVSAPVSAAPNSRAPVYSTSPVSAFTPMPSSPGVQDEEKPSYFPPSWYTPSPSNIFYTMRPSPWATAPISYNNVCSNNMNCQDRPCGLADLGGEEVRCCMNWSTLDIWSGERWESYCWGLFGIGEACYDSWLGDSMCQSQICHAGVCANQRGAVGEACTDSRNCTNGCGQLTMNAETKECCEYYESSNYNQSGYYTTYCANSFAVGEACIGSDQCDTNICIQGKCALQRLDVGSPCTNYEECSNYACGIGAFNTTENTNFTSMNSTSMMCCPSGSTYGVYTGNNYTEYCAYTIPTGQQCFADQVCQSGICINETATTGFCSASRLPDGATCFSDNHCQNYACGHSSYSVTPGSIKTCCPNGRYEYVRNEYTYDYVQVCARSIPLGEPCSGEQYGDTLCASGFCVQNVCAAERLPNGEQCDGYSDCKSEQCGLDASQYLSDGSSLCCDEAYGIYDEYTYEYLYFCIRTIPTGESCDFGYDGGGYADDDRQGGTSILCQSGICIQGVCSDDYLDDGESCNGNTECSSQVCAFSAFEFSDRERVCCVGEALYFRDSSFNNGEYYCERSVPDGGRCPPTDGNYDNYRVCENGICINAFCTDERQADGEDCENSNDCESQACGLDSADFATRKNICCAAGESVYVSDGFDYQYYCVRNIPLGGQCISSSQNFGSGGLMCTTGICIDDVCVDTRLEDAALCGTNDECDSGACGYNSMDFGTREKVCCEGLCTNQLYDGFGYEDYCVGIQEVGEQCTWDNGRQNEIYPQLCSTGICVDEICSTELQGYQDECNYGTDCIGGACGFTSFNMSSPKICCDWTYSIYDGICGYDEFCAGTFEFGQQCAYRGQRYGQLCSSFSCTVAGTCSNETIPCEEDGGGPEEGEGDHGDKDNPDTGGSTTTTVTSNNNTTMGNFRRRKLEDYGDDTDDGVVAYPPPPSSVPCH